MKISNGLKIKGDIMAKKKAAKKQPDTHVINKKRPTKEPKRIEVVYTIAGKEDYLEDNKYPCVDSDAETAKGSVQVACPECCHDFRVYESHFVKAK